MNTSNEEGTPLTTAAPSNYVWVVYIADHSDSDNRHGPDLMAAICATEDAAKRTIEEIQDVYGVVPHQEYYYQERAVVQ